MYTQFYIRKIYQHGNSWAITLPKRWLRKLKLTPGKYMQVETHIEKEENYIILKNPRSEETMII